MDTRERDKVDVTHSEHITTERAENVPRVEPTSKKQKFRRVKPSFSRRPTPPTLQLPTPGLSSARPFSASVFFVFSFAIAQQAAREMGVIDDVSEVRLFAV